MHGNMNAAPLPQPDNKSDVLASIRKLIAQDDARVPARSLPLMLEPDDRLITRNSQPPAPPQMPYPAGTPSLEQSAPADLANTTQATPPDPAPTPPAEAAPPPAPTPANLTPAPTIGGAAVDTNDLHLFAPVEDELVNSSVLRKMIREAIREELQGEMGARLSRNLRQVIRGEVDVALRQMLRRPGG